MSLEYFLTSLVVIILPGTGVIYTLAWGLGGGARASVLAAFGCTLGIVPHIIASIIGIAALLHASAVAFQIVKYLGVVYLLYMAWSVLRQTGPMQVSEQRTRAPAHKIVVNGLLLNILNPKLSLFFLAFLPQFVPVSAPNPSAEMLLLGALFMALTFIVFLGYGLFAVATRSYVLSTPRAMTWLRRCFAGAFGALGARLALAD